MAPDVASYPSRIQFGRWFKMADPEGEKRSIPWLEICICVAVVALIAQLYPPFARLLGRAAAGLLYCLDIRNWTWAVWGWANFALVILLSSVRFLPEWISSAKQRAKKRAAVRARSEKKRKLQEERETIARVIESRKRRIM